MQIKGDIDGGADVPIHINGCAAVVIQFCDGGEKSNGDVETLKVIVAPLTYSAPASEMPMAGKLVILNAYICPEFMVMRGLGLVP
jgi:hypothetical protein